MPQSVQRTLRIRVFLRDCSLHGFGLHRKPLSPSAVHRHPCKSFGYVQFGRISHIVFRFLPLLFDTCPDSVPQPPVLFPHLLLHGRRRIVPSCATFYAISVRQTSDFPHIRLLSASASQRPLVFGSLFPAEQFRDFHLLEMCAAGRIRKAAYPPKKRMDSRKKADYSASIRAAWVPARRPLVAEKVRAEPEK